jgi:hypothetical protein
MTLTKLLKRRITRDQSRDTGMALVLLLLILYLVLGHSELVYAAIAVHVANMMLPQLYRHFAVLWFGLSELIGMVVSKIVLGVVFFGLVTPLGLLRKSAGKDPLKLRGFKANSKSVMVIRNHKFQAADLEKPY